ncbi:MAG: molybdenum cofactor guanylyltransferase [Candidatus Hydrogenedentes bacterium]|nr:molybdenum cofactor guanylyltransferase [Candidatus Hydrogenedentota bacterium]
MGRDKRLIPWCGRPLIGHIATQIRPFFHEILVSTNDPAPIAALGLPTVPDAQPDQGPLMGIASALQRARCPWNFVVATDIPEIPIALIRRLWAQTAGARCVVPREEGGRLQPLFGFYHRCLAEVILVRLASGERRVRAVIEEIHPRTVPIAMELVRNVNTWEEVARIRPGGEDA